VLKDKLPTPAETDGEALGPERHRTAAITAIVLFVVVVVGYLCSPLDLIPDAIPVLGWLDDGVAMLLSSAGVAISASYLQGYELSEWRERVPPMLRRRAIRWGLVAIAAGVLVIVALLVLAAVVVWAWPLVAPGQT